MKCNLFPDHYMSSAYDIPYRDLYNCGKRALIFDIDNTLVEHGAPANDEAVELLTGLLKMGYRICFLSNNKEERVKSFNERIGADYIYKAGKPGKKGYLKAMAVMGSTVKNTVFIGDQIFTDVWGAKRLGMETFLTKPISKKEEIQIVFKRILEKPILFLYRLLNSRSKQ